MSEDQTLRDSSGYTFSAASADGITHCDSLSGQSELLFGQPHARVSRFRVPVDAAVRKTNGTSGRNYTASSASVALASFLGNRLIQQMDVNGSMEFVWIWKNLTMPSGRKVLQPVVSGRRTSGSGCTGLGGIAKLAGYNTPRATDGENGGPNQAGGALSHDAALASFATPASRDWKDTPGMATEGTNPDGSTRQRVDQLPRQAHGAITTSSRSETGKSGVLASVLSMWLMGYPPEWNVTLFKSRKDR
jgi:hypothetical protein